MSVRAGSIITVAGRNVVDRLQSAALSGSVPIETIREVGNDLVVGKVPGEADFNFSLESWDVSTDLMAFLHGLQGQQAANQPPGAADPDGTEYRWDTCGFVNLASVWKRDTGPQGGHIAAGLALPGYYPTRITHRYGVTENAAQTVEVNGGEFYLAKRAAVEEVVTIPGGAVGVGLTTFVTSEPARPHRLGGNAGTTYDYVWGVLVNNQLQVEGEDYDVSGGTAPPGPSTPVTITFTRNLAIGDVVKYVYFTETDKAYPQAVHADTIIKPAAVRGRNIVVLVGDRDAGGGSQQEILHGVQTYEQDASITGVVDREMGNAHVVGRAVEGTDCSGTITFRGKDIDAIMEALKKVTGVNTDEEVVGYFNESTIPLEVQIQNPKNPGQILKTHFIEQAQFQPPVEAFRVNTPVDFPLTFSAADGTYSEFKGARGAVGDGHLVR